ncbi:MAG TPA: hypothetical protein VH877_23435 [Polyangia bacterium]|nr:hypothetical protein [Polyangia bacterium]
MRRPRTRVPIGLTALFALAACHRPAPPPPPAPAPDVDPGRHDQEGHEHSAPHGGLVASTAGGHLELRVSPSGLFKLFVLDPDLELRKLPKMTGTLLVAIPGYPEVPLDEHWEDLEGRGPALTRQRFAVVAILRAAEIQESARFVVDFAVRASAETRPHHHGPPRAGTTPMDSIIGRVVDRGCVPTAEAPRAPGASGPLMNDEPPACAQRQPPPAGALAVVEETSGRTYVPKAGAEILVPLVGRRCQVFGKLLRDTDPPGILIQSAEPEHDHTPQHPGGGVTMVGDLHLEAVAYASGEVRVYLSDTFRQPLPVAGYRGTVELSANGGPQRPAPLTTAAGNTYLRATFPPLGRLVELTVRLPMPTDPSYFITFQLASQPAAPPSNPTP